MLHDGIRSGGVFYRKGLRPVLSESVVRTHSRKSRRETPGAKDLDRDFEALIENCDGAQARTQDLFFGLKKRRTGLDRDLKQIQDRLTIMRSMPDLTVSPSDLEEFIDNISASKPKLQQEGGHDSVKGGSIRHVFPLRDWVKGGIKHHVAAR